MSSSYDLKTVRSKNFTHSRPRSAPLTPAIKEENAHVTVRYGERQMALGGGWSAGIIENGIYNVASLNGDPIALCITLKENCF